MAIFDDFGNYDAVGLAGLVRDRQVTPAELVETAIERIERVNPQLNALVTRMYDEARRKAEGALPEGPFHGVPFLLKDLVATYAGVRLTAGTRFYAGYVPDHDSTLVHRYRNAGLITVGKTSTPEFGLTPVTEPELHGPTHTPWKTGHNAGGSSGGSGALVGARAVPMGHGGDGGGSIRIPAACCGVFGLKPTRARTPAGPDASEDWQGFAIEHAITVSVRDSATLLDATSGPETGAIYWAPPVERPFADEVGRAPGKLRIAFTARPHMVSDVHPDCVAAVRDAADLLEKLGHEVEERSPEIDQSRFASDFTKVVAAELATTIAEGQGLVGRKATREDFETPTWLVSMIGRQLPAHELLLARRRLQALARRVARFFEDHDVLLTPTLGGPPPRHFELRPAGAEALVQEVVAAARLGPVLRLPGLVDILAEKVFSFIPFTPLANVTGQPSMNVPLHWNGQGLPIGTMFTGRFGDEATLLRLASQLEQERPWRDRKPPVCAD